MIINLTKDLKWTISRTEFKYFLRDKFFFSLVQRYLISFSKLIFFFPLLIKFFLMMYSTYFFSLFFNLVFDLFMKLSDKLCSRCLFLMNKRSCIRK